MASAAPSMDVEEEFTCPICMEYLTDPVVLDCGHSFCQGCITTYCEKWEELGDLECPICKCRIQKGNFRRNWQLAHIVEKMRLWSLKPGKEDRCKKHEETLLLFCKEDEKLVCVLCERSPEHKGHTIVLLEEAAQQQKEEIRRCLEIMRNEKENILVYKADAEKESQSLLEINNLQRQKTEILFGHLYQVLEEQQKHLLAEIEDVEKEIARKRDQCLARLSEEITSLESLIQEMEEKIQQPAVQVLQDIRSTRQRYQKKEKFENPANFFPELKKQFWDVWVRNWCLKGVMDKFQDTLVLEFPFQKVNVTLDPASVSSYRVLSKDLKTITWQKTPQDPSGNPDRLFSYALGSERFTAGHYSWEVSVGSEGGWAVGVAKKFERGRLAITPEEGVWAVGRHKGQYKAFIRGIEPPLLLSGEPKRIRVCLNCDGGQVAFFDADRETLLYRSLDALFSGEALYPFFAVYGKGSLRLSP